MTKSENGVHIPQDFAEQLHELPSLDKESREARAALDLGSFLAQSGFQSITPENLDEVQVALYRALARLTPAESRIRQMLIDRATGTYGALQRPTEYANHLYNKMAATLTFPNKFSVRFAPQENRIFTRLWGQIGNTVPHKDISDYVWEGKEKPKCRSPLQPHITLMRNKVASGGDFGDNTLGIINVYKTGYLLAARKDFPHIVNGKIS